MWKRKQRQRTADETKNVLLGKYCANCLNSSKKENKFYCERSYYYRNHGYEVREYSYCKGWINK